jgi:hypothetical protein
MAFLEFRRFLLEGDLAGRTVAVEQNAQQGADPERQGDRLVRMSPDGFIGPLQTDMESYASARVDFAQAFLRRGKSLPQQLAAFIRALRESQAKELFGISGDGLEIPQQLIGGFGGYRRLFRLHNARLCHRGPAKARRFLSKSPHFLTDPDSGLFPIRINSLRFRANSDAEWAIHAQTGK